MSARREINHVYRLQPCHHQSRVCRSTLFAGVSEGADDIYFLVYGQITGPDIPHYEQILLDSWRDMIETQRRPLESSRRALEYYLVMRKVLDAIIS
jgi:hypothetical protein